MTALDPPGHGVRHNGIFRLPDAIPTLAERLREAGHATGAVVGSQVLDRRYGLDRGFDFYDDRLRDRLAGGSGWPERRADAGGRRGAGAARSARLALLPVGAFLRSAHGLRPAGRLRERVRKPALRRRDRLCRRPARAPARGAARALGRGGASGRRDERPRGELRRARRPDALLSGLRDDAARSAAARGSRNPGRPHGRRAGGPGRRGADRARARACASPSRRPRDAI